MNKAKDLIKLAGRVNEAKATMAKADYNRVFKALQDMKQQANKLADELADVVPEHDQQGDDPASQVLAVHDILDDTIRSFKDFIQAK